MTKNIHPYIPIHTHYLPWSVDLTAILTVFLTVILTVILPFAHTTSATASSTLVTASSTLVTASSTLVTASSTLVTASTLSPTDLSTSPTALATSQTDLSTSPTTATFSTSARTYDSLHPLMIEGEIERPPYEFMDRTGTPTGFNVDLLTTMVKRLGIPYRVQLKNWPQVISDLHLRRADLACCVYSEEKLKYFHFSYSIFDSYLNVLVYRKDSGPIHSYSDLKGKTLCVLKNSAALNYLKQRHFDGRIIQTNNMKDIIDSVDQGKAFGAITGQQPARYHIFKGGYSNLAMTDLDLFSTSYHFVSSDQQLLHAIDSVYTLLVNEGQVDNLYNAWFHAKVEKNVIPESLYNIFYILLISCFLLIVFICIYRIKLRRSLAIINEKNTELESLFDVTAVSVLKYDLHTRRVDNMMGHILPEKGLSHQEMLETIHPADRSHFADILSSMISASISEYKQVFKCDYQHSGKWFYVEGAMKRVENISDHHVLVLISVKDITDSFINNLTRDSLYKRYSAVFNSTNVGLVYWDNNDILTDINSMALTMLGISDKDRVLARHLSIYNVYQYNLTIDECNNGFYGVMKFNLDEIYKDYPETNRRGIVYLEQQITPLYNTLHQKIGTIVTMIDKTYERERYMAEVAMRKRLKEETDKAQQADKLKSAFLANMSHEIRTPLNSIVGFSELMCKQYAPDEKEQFINIISNNTKLLLRLINDILDISKLDANIIQVKPEEIEFSNYFKHLSNALSHQVQTADVQFLTDNPYRSCVLSIDKERMSQLITNLVVNAGKFTRHGHIKIGYHCTDDQLEFYCEDTGVGMTPEQSTKIFDRFYKGNDFVPGTGLGLSICKKIVEQCDGTITVQSTPNKGTTFRICMPVVIKKLEI